jgi:hypothetical protein
VSDADPETDRDESEKDWIYRDSTKKLLMNGLLIACAVSVLLEVFVLGREKHKPIDWGFGFYAALGFVMCSLMIFAAKGLGFWLKVRTDFYDESPAGSEDDGEEGSK